MNPDDRRLLREWLRREADKPGRLADALRELSEQRKDLEPHFRFLIVKAEEEQTRRALVDREKWHRSLSFRLISLLFGITGVALIGFVWWGKPEAFNAAVFFFFGCMAYYLAVQLLVSLRSLRAKKAWDAIHRKYMEDLDAIQKEIR